MAGFPYLAQIPDPGTKIAVQKLWEEFNALKAEVAGLKASALQPSGGSLDAKNSRVVNVANPQADSDAVNLGTLRTVVQAQVESFS